MASAREEAPVRVELSDEELVQMLGIISGGEHKGHPRRRGCGPLLDSGCDRHSPRGQGRRRQCTDGDADFPQRVGSRRKREREVLPLYF
jgi:hypothetical protein